MALQIIDEGHPSKVAGIYSRESEARDTLNLLRCEGGFTSEEVTLVAPDEEHYGKKVEPDNKGIARTFLGSHILLGIAGLVLGLMIAGILSLFGPALTSSNPAKVFIAMPVLGVFIGLLVAGVLTLRPDHDHLINQTRDATLNHKWTIVVQSKDDTQTQRAKNLMQDSAVSVVETL